MVETENTHYSDRACCETFVDVSPTTSVLVHQGFDDILRLSLDLFPASYLPVYRDLVVLLILRSVGGCFFPVVGFLYHTSTTGMIMLLFVLTARATYLTAPLLPAALLAWCD